MFHILRHCFAKVIDEFYIEGQGVPRLCRAGCVPTHSDPHQRFNFAGEKTGFYNNARLTLPLLLLEQ